MDYAVWFLWASDGTLNGIIASHVDDLLCGGNGEAMKSLDLLGKELGFGSLSCDEFQYCGKKISQQEDGTIRVSMEEYHTNLKTVPIPATRRKQLDSDLTAAELKQLRGLLGSL